MTRSAAIFSLSFAALVASALVLHGQEEPKPERPLGSARLRVAQRLLEQSAELIRMADESRRSGNTADYERTSARAGALAALAAEELGAPAPAAPAARPPFGQGELQAAQAQRDLFAIQAGVARAETAANKARWAADVKSQYASEFFNAADRAYTEVLARIDAMDRRDQKLRKELEAKQAKLREAGSQNRSRR